MLGLAFTGFRFVRTSLSVMGPRIVGIMRVGMNGVGNLNAIELSRGMFVDKYELGDK